ncbi:MAG: diphosphate--fructose-6-phosphate 1-phosphotransferase [Paludibacteraceae bacterium]|nr:diphosphate--fructose-6-phosphate 1-phosphotransferase [Paludibacteraceae bacterium]
MSQKEVSPLHQVRLSYAPKLPEVLTGPVRVKQLNATESAGDQEAIRKLFPMMYGKPVVGLEASSEAVNVPALNVGVILSGGQAPGGHNVISGLFDGLKSLNADSKLYGFLGGPSGLIEHKYIELTKEIVDQYRNTGGFDIIGSGRTKLEETWQFDKGEEICKQLDIKAIVIIGGDDSNTNACVLAEYYLQKGNGIQVIGCPKTIDGDLKNEYIETSFGFDTACKVYSELIGNIQRDAASAKKYWHFIRLMGRSASHIALECALETHPNVTIVSEEVATHKWSLSKVVDMIVDSVMKRAEGGKNYGVVLVPEGLLEFVPEMNALIGELNDILAGAEESFKTMTLSEKSAYVSSKLTDANAKVFGSLPEFIAKQLMADRDAHGNVAVSQIETEKMLIEMVKVRLDKMSKEGTYKGKFSSLSHFFGYEGRCAMPSNFDADYCYSLGYNAAVLIAAGLTGYMSLITNVSEPSEKWIAGGIPIVSMFNMERRSGADKPVIRKALVKLDGKPFQFLQEHREEWSGAEDCFVFPGPVQLFGPSEICDRRTVTLQLESEK